MVRVLFILSCVVVANCTSLWDWRFFLESTPVVIQVTGKPWLVDSLIEVSFSFCQNGMQWLTDETSLLLNLFIVVHYKLAQCLLLSHIGLASDDVAKLSNAWQRRKLVLNKGTVPYKSMLGEKSLTGQSSLFLRREVWTVLTTSSQLSASHFKRYWGSDKSGPFFGRSTITQHAFVWDAIFV